MDDTDGTASGRRSSANRRGVAIRSEPGLGTTVEVPVPLVG